MSSSRSTVNPKVEFPPSRTDGISSPSFPRKRTSEDLQDDDECPPRNRKRGTTSSDWTKWPTAVRTLSESDNPDQIEDKLRRAQNSKRESKVTDIELRTHCRVDMAPLGTNLANFKTLKGLMRTFNDVVQSLSISIVLALLSDGFAITVIRMLWRDGTTHRDINFRTILLHEHEGHVRGLLLDFDCAIPEVSSDTFKGPVSSSFGVISVHKINYKQVCEGLVTVHGHRSSSYRSKVAL